MDRTRTVRATLAGALTLKVVKASRKKGSGTITSGPAGIACGNNCRETYPTSTVATLTATPDPGSTFTGWVPKSICSGTGACNA